MIGGNNFSFDIIGRGGGHPVLASGVDRGDVVADQPDPGGVDIRPRRQPARDVQPQAAEPECVPQPKGMPGCPTSSPS